MRSNARFRIRIITGVILVVALVIIMRLYHVQVMQHEYFLDRAERQYTHTVSSVFNRGSIFFTTKDGEEVSAATLKVGYVLAINPEGISNPEATYQALSSVIELEREDFIEKAQDPERTYIEIQRRLTQPEGEAISALGLRGVLLYKDQWRYYPGETLQARSLGFVAYNQDDLSGRYGLEHFYDDVLRRDNETFSVNFFAEIFSNLEQTLFDNALDKEGDVVTSIEPTVARTLESELKELHEEWNPAMSGGIIMNPQTGDIYALGTYPHFDLNDRSGVAISSFRNPLVEDVYEFGSIIKPLTMAAGIDAGVVTPQSTYVDHGSIELDSFTIYNFDGKARGLVDMQEVLSQSLNTGVSHIVEEMGTKRFGEYFKALKLGSETGIDLPNETFGLTQNLNSPRKVEYATASFGQGIALTPIGAARSLATLANGGVLPNPHIAERITYVDGTEYEISFPEGERIFEEATTEEVSRMLVEVVDSALRYGEEKRERHTIAAKTGTAQIPDPVEGGYYDDRFLHSFFGYFPAYDPQFLILLFTIEPKEVRYASETLTSPFMDLTDFLINYYDVPPDR